MLGCRLVFAMLFFHGKGAQGHTLVDLHMLPDSGSLPDYNPRSVIDEKGISDLCSRMNIDPRFPMDIFCHHPWNSGTPKRREDIGNPVHRNAIKPG